jgi:hypothetical protein
MYANWWKKGKKMEQGKIGGVLVWNINKEHKF